NPDTAEENLHQTALHFWMEHDLFDQLAAEVYGVYRQRMPSAGVFSAPITANYFLGVARSGNYRSRQLDVKRNVQVVRAPDGQTRFNFMSHIGIQGSFLEGFVLDQLFGRGMHPALSTAQILMEAGRQNIPVYRITARNIDAALPLLAVSEAVKEDIAHAVRTGKHAVVPQSDLQIGNWTGTGYIIQDLDTGAGAYLLEGGLNGGIWEGCEIEQAKPLHMRPDIYLKKNFLFEKFEKEMAELKAEMAAAKTKAEIDSVNYKLDLTVMELVSGLSLISNMAFMRFGEMFKVSGGGCFVVLANGEKEKLEIIVPDRRYQAGVVFSAASITHCLVSTREWTLTKHGDSGSEQLASVKGRAALPAVLGAGKYTGAAAAECLSGGEGRKLMSDSVEVEIGLFDDDIAQSEFCDAKGSGEGDPVLTAIGAQYLRKPLLSVQGLLPVAFTVEYNSLLLKKGVLGRGWSHKRYSARLEEDEEGNVTVHWHGNRHNRFLKQADGNYAASYDHCRFDRLRKNAGGGFTLRRKRNAVYEFSAAGQLLRTGDRHGRFLTLSYDGSGRLHRVTEPLSGVYLQYGYYSSGLLASVSDPLGRKAWLYYDNSGNLTRMNDAAGQNTDYTYNSHGQIVTVTGHEGQLLARNVYDDEHRVISQDDARDDNLPLRFAYSGNESSGELTATVTTRTGETRTYVHDAQFRLLSSEDELGGKISHVYNAEGRRARLTDANGHSRSFEYDPQGNLAKIIDEAGQQTRMRYDTEGNLVEVENALHKLLKLEYNADNHLRKITDPLQNQTVFTYDAHGRLETVTRPRQGVTRYGWSLQIDAGESNL
ncbi:MAG: RHS repeat protein, partial [bacterium]|nr:RHS repeat protein [bacterium]